MMNIYGIDLSICEINHLKYMLLDLMEERRGKKKEKKTNIRIDFDFSEVMKMIE